VTCRRCSPTVAMRDEAPGRLLVMEVRDNAIVLARKEMATAAACGAVPWPGSS
jgi:hypothetical protein